VKKIVDECYDSARGLLEKNKDKLEKLAQALLEKEVLSDSEAIKIVGLKKDESANQDMRSSTEEK